MGEVTTYGLKITVLSPVHIGTGERISIKARVDEGGKVGIVDEQALMCVLTQHPHLIAQFETFCFSEDSMGSFLRQHNIPAETVVAYTLPRWGQSPLSRDYFPFIKLPECPPKPYLPGSSLKGAIRSALMRAAVIVDERFRMRMAGRAKDATTRARPNPKTAGALLERHYFSTREGDKNWQNYDWMRLFQFTDAYPAVEDALALTETRLLSLRKLSSGRYKLEPKLDHFGKPMLQNPEVLRPGAVLHGELHILNYLLTGPASQELGFNAKRAEIGYLIRRCNQVAQEQIAQELDFASQVAWDDGTKFYNQLANRWANLTPNTGLVRLGWGTGYDNKTVTDQFDEETFETVRRAYARSMPLGYPGRNPTLNPLPQNLSPKSRKVAYEGIRGRWLPLGWIQVEFQQL